MVRSTQSFVKISATQTERKVLTTRQREVVGLLAAGKTMREAAFLLNLTPRAVAFHKYDVMHKLNLKTTAHLIRFAIGSGILVS